MYLILAMLSPMLVALCCIGGIYICSICVVISVVLFAIPPYLTLICGTLFILITALLCISLIVAAIGTVIALVASGLRWVYEIFLEITGRARVPEEVPPGEVPMKEEEYTYRTATGGAV